MSHFTIGTLARAAQVNVETIRFYERQGLLEQPARRAAGYRQYEDGDLARLGLIRRAKSLGFTLKEIGELLGPDGTRCAEDVRRAALAKLDELDEQLRRLRARRARLSELVKVCQDGTPGCVTLAVTGTE